MKTTISIITIIIFATSTLFAQVSYSQYDAFLSKYVSATGNVNYSKIKENKTELDAIIKDFQTNVPQKSWSKNAQLAYWINAYNAFTIKLIVDNYPITSIMKLDKGKTWDVKRIEIGGKKYSLNNIENDVIRPTHKDARVHFALNCAAKSCPPLYNNAFTEKNVQSLLEQRTKQYINSKALVLNVKNIKISKIFDWYKSDFSDIVVFLNKYASISIDADAKIGFLEYDWSLNQ